MLEFRHLRALAALAEAGSVTAAARRVHLTQSALSHQLQELERGLDAPLFVRKSRPLRFTPAGERLLQLARQTLPEVEAALAEARRRARGETGRLHVAIECHSCYLWLMPAANRFRDAWPAVEFDLAGGPRFDAQPQLLDGALDLVITGDPEALPGLAHEPLFDFEMRLVVARDHALARKAAVRPADLAGETLLTYPVPRGRLDVFRRFLAPAGVEPAAVRTAEVTLVILQWVAAGRGVAALPAWAVTEYVEQDYLACCRLGAKGLWSTLHAVFRREQREAPFVRDFLDIVRDTCRRRLPGIRPIGTRAAQRGPSVSASRFVSGFRK